LRAYSLVLYLAVLAIVVTVFFYAEGNTAPPPPPAPLPAEDTEIGGPPLPPASDFDPEVWVALPEEASNSTGTAFSIDQGVWMTARHVVDGCSRVALVVRDNSGVIATGVRLAQNADLAIIDAPLEREPLALDLARDGHVVGEDAFLIGFPQGYPGEVAVKLLGRETMLVRGRYATREPVLAWAESSRTQGLRGSLGGLSGGPAIDGDGQVIGVTVAEAPRRGRIYTAAPRSLAAALTDTGASGAPGAARVGDVTQESYGLDGRRLRRQLRVAKVSCAVADSAGG